MNNKKLPILKNENFLLRLLVPEEASLMLNYRLLNKDHLAPWEPIRPPGWRTEQFWRFELQRYINNYHEEKELRFAILSHDESKVIGICKFTGIVKGAFKACYLGFSLDKCYEGKGMMFNVLKIAIPFTFNHFNLHRIMANYIPKNKRSDNLLKRLGFEKEGFAKSYLKIAGKWEDHILTSLINQNLERLHK